ncbi:MAG: TraR/DksA family transcriptional regulator [Rhodospirillaceae bacterium]|jgi:DnaK suppressor protein|nr:TraR/DksA family transcriptional regulator [Rhodospirillaceae bacterium]
MLDIAKAKTQLEESLRELGARVEGIEADLRVPHSADWPDRATEIEDDDMLDALEDSAIKEIRDIRAALLRIEAGTYDICRGCGGKIDPKRLVALPYAAECIQCAEAG